MKTMQVEILPEGVELHHKTIRHDGIVICRDEARVLSLSGTGNAHHRELMDRIEALLVGLTVTRVRKNFVAPGPECMQDDELEVYLIPSRPRISPSKKPK